MDYRFIKNVKNSNIGNYICRKCKNKTPHTEFTMEMQGGEGMGC